MCYNVHSMYVCTYLHWFCTFSLVRFTPLIVLIPLNCLLSYNKEMSTASGTTWCTTASTPTSAGTSERWERSQYSPCVYIRICTSCLCVQTYIYICTETSGLCRLNHSNMEYKCVYMYVHTHNPSVHTDTMQHSLYTHGRMAVISIYNTIHIFMHVQENITVHLYFTNEQWPHKIYLTCCCLHIPDITYVF